MTTILDPTDERTPVERQITKRTGTLSGVVGLLDISKPRGNVLLDELAAVGAKSTGRTVRRFTKPTFAKPCPDALRHEIRDQCDLVSKAWPTEDLVRRAVCTTTVWFEIQGIPSVSIASSEFGEAAKRNAARWA